VTNVAVSPWEMGPVPTMVLASWGLVRQPSAFTHWSIPSITDRTSLGFLFGVPLYRAIGSLTLWNSIVGTALVGWMVGNSTCPSTEAMAAMWSEASAAMA